MQALCLNSILHEIRLRHNGRDGQTHRNSHTTQRSRILREILVATAHAARIEVRIRAHGREVEAVDARLREHEDADASGFFPYSVEVVPGGIVGGAVGEERSEQVPHVVDFGRDVGLHPVFETVGLGHINDCLCAGEQEGAPDIGGDVAHKLSAEARDFAIVAWREAAEEHRPEGEVGNDLVDHACHKQGSSFAGAYEFHGRARFGGQGEAVT